MNKHRSRAVLSGLLVLSYASFTGCIDDDYDITDIDTTTRLEVKDLTLPVNLTPIRFDDVIDLTDNDYISIVDGKYIFTTDGTFESEHINIDAITAHPQIEEQPEPVPLVVGQQAVVIPSVSFPFTYTDTNVDDYIDDVYGGKLDFDITLRMELQQANKGLPCTYSDLVLEVPAGLYGTCLTNGQTINKGDAPEIRISSYNATDGVLSVVYHVTSFDADAAGVVFDADAQSFNIATEFALREGKIAATSGFGSANLAINLELGTLHVLSLDGELHYDVNNLDAQEAILNGLPDILTDPNTNIGLQNPQIYLSINNPVGHYDIEGVTNFTIRQDRTPTPIVSLDNPIHLKGQTGMQLFCISPERPESLQSGFESAIWYSSSNLGEVLSGKGLPSKLIVDFENPHLERAVVRDFLLGVDLGTIHGSYHFYTELDFTEQSQLLYTDSELGWDVGSDFHITHLALYAKAKSELPVDVSVICTPLDMEGNTLKDEVNGQDLTITPAIVRANGESDIMVEISGQFSQLDGMRYNVLLTAGSNASALTPEVNLTLSDIKVVASGYYESVDDDSND